MIENVKPRTKPHKISVFQKHKGIDIKQQTDPFASQHTNKRGECR